MNDWTLRREAEWPYGWVISHKDGAYFRVHPAAYSSQSRSPEDVMNGVGMDGTHSNAVEWNGLLDDFLKRAVEAPELAGALRIFEDAYQTGRNEPLVIASEHARAVLARLEGK